MEIELKSDVPSTASLLSVNQEERCNTVDFVCFHQRQYHSQIDNLIEETVKEMITLLVAKVASPLLVSHGLEKHTHSKRYHSIERPLSAP